MPARSPAAAILVVEDDRHALNGYIEFLWSAGFQVTGVPDGAEALAILHRHPADLVVTDITVPGLSGFEVAAALRANPDLRDIPIIGLTGHWTADVRARAAGVGMTAMLLKPCVPAHLLAEVERLLRPRIARTATDHTDGQG
ncbi:MAG TPA: response regulator [Vicinamibacterales bacterium]|nr:response regulator [Vicinamibacterales bacterium]